MRDSAQDFPVAISDRCIEIEAQLRHEFGVTQSKERYIDWLELGMAGVGIGVGLLVVPLIVQLPYGTIAQRTLVALIAWPLVTLPLTNVLLRVSRSHLRPFIAPQWTTFEATRRARWDAELQAHYRKLDAQRSRQCE